MSDFEDVYLPDSIRRIQFVSSPRWSTTITTVASGDEHRNKNWKHPLHRFVAPAAIDCHDIIEDLRDHWMVMGGPFLTFPFRDPLDFASRRLDRPNLAPEIFMTDQAIGIGDGITRSFQLTKTYTRGTRAYTRKITLPIVASVAVAINALTPDHVYPALPGGPYTWAVDRTTGIVTFDHAPLGGQAITAGFLFDVPTRFESDDIFDQIVQAYQVDGVADLSFLETRPCTNGASS